VVNLNDCQILIINLDSRTDRWEEVQKEMLKIRINNYQRFSAIRGGESGCAKSHYECLKSGIGNLLIFEDDVCFDENALENINKALLQLPEDFDVFYLGANVKQPAQKYSENLFTAIEGVHTTHAMLYSEKGRKEILKIYDPNLTTLPIDHWFWVYGMKLLKCFICYPIQAFQRAGYTDIRLSYQDYKEEMLQNQKINMI